MIVDGKAGSQLMDWRQSISQRLARLWQRLYALQFRLLSFIRNHGVKLLLLGLALVMLGSLFLLPNLQHFMASQLATETSLSGFQTLLVTLGGSLVGAAAIAFSLIMFAMQVNVERMPHGLFRRFSSDIKLMSAFGMTFLVAVTIMVLSLVSSIVWIGLVALMSGWGTMIIVLLFLYAYRRALSLISPTKQLGFVLADTRKDLKIWEKRIKRAEPLLSAPVDGEQEEGGARPDHDSGRIAFFRLYPSWDRAVKQGLSYSTAFARRYAEQGDHEVAAVALMTIIQINAAYIDAKGKTFFSYSYLLDTGLSTDGIINESLEQLRQNVRIGISRGDEQQIEQSFAAMAQLCAVYVKIDYVNEFSNKTHANLAAGYLSEALKSVVPHNMPDVLMEGLRLLGECALLILKHDGPTQVVSISEAIASIAVTGAVNEKLRPVSQRSVLQLANLTFELLKSEKREISFTLKQVRKDIDSIATLFLSVPDLLSTNIHSSTLGPYYSTSTFEGFGTNLRLLITAVSNADENDKNAQRLIRNLNHWADGLYQTQKELFLLAIGKRSNFVFDLVLWVVAVTKQLLAVASARACEDRQAESLRKHALWLVSIFSWVPDEQEAISFVENIRLTENLFEVALYAHQRNCNEVATAVSKLLLDWGFKSGKYQIGWATLERSFYGSTTLVILRGEDAEAFITSVLERLSQGDAPSTEIRIRTARDIRDRLRTPHGRAHSLIEDQMAQVDQEALRDLLNGIACALDAIEANQVEDGGQ